MSKRADKDYIRDIAESVGRIRDYIGGMDYEAFLGDKKTQDAVIRNLEVMGEAAKKVSEGVRERWGEIPWKSMAGVRDRLIHDYFGVNLDIVWQIVSEELPSVASRVEEIVEEE